MSALLIRRRRPLGEPPASPASPDSPASRHGAGLVHGTTGAGRIALALSAFGLALDDILQAVIDTTTPVSELNAFDVGRRFDLVILGSHLINLPDEAARAAFVLLGRRHLATAGRFLIEHHPLDWATTAAATPSTPGGSQPGMVDVRRDPPFVSAVSVYDVGGRVVRQPFRARVLSEEELASTVEAVGLAVRSRLGPTWLEATTAG